MLAIAAPPATAARTDPDSAITYVPAFLFLEGAPGKRVQTQVLVQNQTEVDAAFTTQVVDVEAGRGDSDALEFVERGSSRRGAGDWVERVEPATFEIAAGRQQVVSISIEIPEDAGPGGWFAAITFTAREPRPTSDLDVDYVSPVPIFLTVDGDYERDLRATLEPPERWRWTGGRAAWTLQLHNAGDVHEVVAARMQLDGPLSSERSRDLRDAILLPGERRRLSVPFALRDAPDVLEARARVARVDAAEVRATAPRMVVLPWWLLVLVALAVAVIGWRLRTRAGRSDPEQDDDVDDGSWDPSAPAG